MLLVVRARKIQKTHLYRRPEEEGPSLFRNAQRSRGTKASSREQLQLASAWEGGAVGRGVEADLWSSHRLYLGSGLPPAGTQCSAPGALRNS